MIRPAAAAALQPDLLQLEECHLRVIEEDGVQCGRVLRDPAGYLMQAAVGANALAFEQVYLDILSKP